MDDRSAVPVYVVDDDPSVRDALRYMLEGYGFTVQSFDSGERFLEEAPLDAPGCLILDHRMPGINGQQVHEHLNAIASCLEVIFLTSHADLPLAVRAFRDGACDFHEKPVSAADLVPSIEKGQAGSLARHARAGHRARYETLSRRERQIFALVVEGLMNKQIAERLCIAVRTVEVHRAKMMERLGAQNITDLMKIAEALRE